MMHAGRQRRPKSGPGGVGSAWQQLVQRLAHNEYGFTLVEELVALGMIGAGLVLLVAMIGTGTVGVTTQRDQVLADAVSRSQLELIKDATYQPDPDSVAYPVVSVPAGYSLAVDVDFWDQGSGSFVGGPNGSGLQRVTVTVSRGGDLLAEVQALKADR